MISVESRKQESLADFVRRIRAERGFSTTDVERNSKVGGGKGISDAYVTRIENSYVTNVSPEKLKSLARGLKVAEEELFAVVRGVEQPAPTLGFEDLQGRVQRRELMALLFDDIPNECQLDSLASMIGLHQRRGRSRRIHERSAARALTKESIESLIKEMLQGSASTPSSKGGTNQKGGAGTGNNEDTAAAA